MGMFDTVRFIPGKSDLPRCAGGHAIEYFQTKDFDCTLETYYVVRDRFYRGREGGSASEHIEHLGDRLEITHRWSAIVFAPGVSEVTIYTSCDQCPGQRKPWVEYTLRMGDDGRIVEMVRDEGGKS